MRHTDRHTGRHANVWSGALAAVLVLVATTVPAMAAPDEQEVVLRDVWNEAPVADAEFDLVGVEDQAARGLGARRDPQRGTWVVRTDETGRLRLPGNLESDVLRSRDGEWTVLHLEEAAPGRRAVVWVHAMVEVRGTVVVDPDGLSAPDPIDLRFDAWAHGRADSPLHGQREPGPGVTGSWLHQRRFTRFHRLGGEYRAVGDDRRFAFELPRVPVMNVFARVPNSGDDPTCNWAPACVRITARQMAERRAELRIEFELGHFVAGRLVDPYGRAVRDTEFTLYVKRQVTAEEFDPAVLTMVGHGYGGHGSSVENWFHAVYDIQGRSDGEGRFAVTSFSEGEAFLAVRPDTNLNDAIFELGDVTQGPESRELVVPHAQFSHRVRLLDRNGQPFGGHRVVLLDVQHEPVQAGRQVDLDEAGTFPARMLVPGHEYLLHVTRSGGGFPRAQHRFVWTGQKQLDLSPFRVTSGGRTEPDDSE